jgi:uncharacterized protein (DUF1800 family)
VAIASNSFERDVASAWARYEPKGETPWNRRRVVHLHRRAGFAATWDEIERDLAEGPERAIERVVDPRSRVSPKLESASDNNGASDENGSPPRRTALREFETMARTIGDAAVASGNANRLKAWWLYRMLYSPDPLGERLTLLWHNHFATSNRKVQDLALMREQNELLRQYARAPFGQLLRAVVKHPAMLVWLDADANRKGHPNENLARELLELFTLGIGHYTESDVQAAAAALTGWAVVSGRFGFREARHDAADKTFLGRHGSLDGDALLQALLDHAATAERLAARVCSMFFGESVLNDADRHTLAEGLRANDLNIGWAVETVLRSQLFFSENNLGSRVAGPIEWTIGAVRALELIVPPPSTLLLGEWTTRMGQELFYPPNVGGWSEGRAWLGSHSVLARANFAAALIEGRDWHPSQPRDLRPLVERHHTTDDFAEQVSWLTELLWGSAPSVTVAKIIAAANDENPQRRLSIAAALILAQPESQLM